jgi:cyclophilin family peptidyl-prolyl cis-trans isomerase
MKKGIKNIILIILIIAVIIGIGFLLFNAIRSVKYNEEAKNPVVTLDVEGYGQVKIELYPEYAPNTVKTFIKLVQNGYYDGKIFYGTDGQAVAAGMSLTTSEEYSDDSYDEDGNLIEGAVAETSQTAEEDELRVSDLDKSVVPYVSEDSEEYDTLNEDEIGSEDTDYKVTIPGEFVANGYNNNTLRFEYGTVGIYRYDYTQYVSSLSTESYNSGSSLFFIETKEDSTLNGQYAAFGKVIEGMDIIEQLMNLPLAETEDDEETSEDTIRNFAEGSFPVITSATVETFGIDYGMPEYSEAFDYSSYMSQLLLQYYQNQ